MKSIIRLSSVQFMPVRGFSSVRRALPIKRKSVFAPQSATTSSPTTSASTASPVSASTTSPANISQLDQNELVPEHISENTIGQSSDNSSLKTRFPLKDSASVEQPSGNGINWSDSFHGLGQQAFSKDATDLLLAPLALDDIEIKPDGLLYLPEIKYRRILNRAFGPGAWGLAPRTETLVTPKQVSREYALICNGRLVSVARGEQDYFGGEEKLTTALEGCKSNALMRCCKDLGIASELWDPVFIRKFKKTHCDELFAEHVVTKKKKKLWKLKVNSFEYPYKAC